MFTDKAQKVIDIAKGYALGQKADRLDMPALLAAIIHDQEGCTLLSEISALPASRLAALYPNIPAAEYRPIKLALSAVAQDFLDAAQNLAQKMPDRQHPGFINIRHLVCAAGLLESCSAMIPMTALSRDRAISFLIEWQEREDRSPGLEQLVATLRELRSSLLKTVYGQDHAVHDFVEGLFNAEVVAAADAERKTPKAIFVFAGPPGVGKTFLAESGAAFIKRPFKRFDMSGFSGPQQGEQLVGVARMYQGAQPGLLTQFVENNPEAVLLFDEIEKAHLKTIQLFLQILDQGSLTDNFHERNVSFRDTIIILTTNAGKKLYEQPNHSGLHRFNAGFHRKTLLDALATEKDPTTGQAMFPAAICSRLATGYPILFNHLGIHELERVVTTEFGRLARLFELEYYKQLSFAPLAASSLVLREGADLDARTLRAQTEKFVKAEIFKFCRLFKTERLEEALTHLDSIHFAPDDQTADLNPQVAQLFKAQHRFKILLFSTALFARLVQNHINDMDWFTVSDARDAMNLLGRENMDMALLDLRAEPRTGETLRTGILFDHTPLAAKELQKGLELLQQIHQRLPNLPVFLLSFAAEGQDAGGSIDEELFHACVRAGGAGGLLTTGFMDDAQANWQDERDELRKQLHDIMQRLYRQAAAAKLGQEHQVLQFDTAPRIDQEKRKATIRMRNLRLVRALASADVGEMMEEVDRPRTRFTEVYGAQSAKEELQFFIDYLKEPRRFAAMGLKPPKGVLLYGPPGTGKTMLARAMAGESGVAFISASASSFVTIWQGSGPQNVRDLFSRARKYAPAVVFIDEIDAIGKTRAGAAGGAEASENTLNALLTEMDGFTSPSTDRPVFVLAATNFNVEAADAAAPERSARTLDPALVRRFSRAVLVDLPDRAVRELYLEKRLMNNPGCEITPNIIRLLAERSAGLAIANLEQIIEAAGRNALKQNGKITDRLLEEAFETVRFGEKKSWDAEEIKRTARHEAGHAVMYWLAGHWPAYVTIVSRGNFGGYMARSAEELEQQHLLTRQQLLADIRVKLAGRAAELLFYGQEQGLSTGASGDLESATRTARDMICRYGMDAELGPLAVPELLNGSAAWSNPEYRRINDKAGAILKEQMALTEELLEKNRQQLQAVADALAVKERLTRKDLEEILHPD